MIVFDLKCGDGHVFEAWFGSSPAWEEQRAAGLVACPICGNGDVAKAAMAPNVGAKGNSRAANRVAVPPGEAPPPEVVKAAMEMIYRWVKSGRGQKQAAQVAQRTAEVREEKRAANVVTAETTNESTAEPTTQERLAAFMLEPDPWDVQHGLTR